MGVCECVVSAGKVSDVFVLPLINNNKRNKKLWKGYWLPACRISGDLHHTQVCTGGIAGWFVL